MCTANSMVCVASKLLNLKTWVEIFEIEVTTTMYKLVSTNGLSLPGADSGGRGHQLLTWALFGENVCKNKRIGSSLGGGASETFVCRSAAAKHLCY